MEDKLKRINGFIPLLTASVVLCAFLFYMVAYFFIKGLDSGYGITSTIGSQEELIATGLILLMSFIDEIIFKALLTLFSSWKVYIVSFISGLVIGVIIVLFEKKTNKKLKSSLFPSPKQYLGYVSIILIVLYLFISCPITALNKGKEIAFNNIKLANEKGCDVESEIWGKCSIIRYENLLKSVELEGYLLHKKDREITIYLPKEKVLRTLVLPKDAIIERHYLKSNPN